MQVFTKLRPRWAKINQKFHVNRLLAKQTLIWILWARPETLAVFRQLKSQTIRYPSGYLLTPRKSICKLATDLVLMWTKYRVDTSKDSPMRICNAKKSGLKMNLKSMTKLSCRSSNAPHLASKKNPCAISICTTNASNNILLTKWAKVVLDLEVDSKSRQEVAARMILWTRRVCVFHRKIHDVVALRVWVLALTAFQIVIVTTHRMKLRREAIISRWF